MTGPDISSVVPVSVVIFSVVLSDVLDSVDFCSVVFSDVCSVVTSVFSVDSSVVVSSVLLSAASVVSSLPASVVVSDDELSPAISSSAVLPFQPIVIFITAVPYVLTGTFALQDISAYPQPDDDAPVFVV